MANAIGEPRHARNAPHRGRERAEPTALSMQPSETIGLEIVPASGMEAGGLIKGARQRLATAAV
eukprot:CAMPEP_0179032102 /NCGR_PEP_ID=MMETSP0796-20121207/11411_1 /TAXON_ID=73915 /ORGANISM="Pyrodinium bahamense, Strain pbaha01" /LENGTH=63 /DNA_ID=CAMNT_0020728311 /DNA_START=106 /DNA_END=293 /DNA_ORIENTATION=+